MEKFIPYEKLSKKQKRKVDAAKRNTWGELNPVTRKPANSKACNRNKARNWKREIHHENLKEINFKGEPGELGSISYGEWWNKDTGNYEEVFTQ